MSVNRNVTVPVGRAGVVSRTAGVLSSNPFSTPGIPIVEPVGETLGTRLGVSPMRMHHARAHDGQAMKGTDESDRLDEADAVPNDGDAALIGRFRFYFDHRHDEPLAGLRARSLAAQLRHEDKRAKRSGRDGREPR